MSSPTQVNATVTPTTSTKRRFLGATRRKKPTSSDTDVPFLLQGERTKQQFPTDGSFQSNEKQKPTKTTFSCLPTNNTTAQFDEKKGAFEDGLSHSQIDNTSEKPLVPITPVRRGKGFLSEKDNSIMPLQLRLEGTAAPSFLSLSQGEQATPVQHQRLAFRHSFGGSARKRFRHDFKSPMRNTDDSSPKLADQPDKAANTDRLQQSLDEIQTEITSLRNEGFCEDELQKHIAKMHEYNELKDTGQMLLGKIAMVEGVTTKDLYKQFGLELND